jgi:membrane protein involved in D-alanine export
VTPYADFLYFGVLLYVAVPSVLYGIAGSLAGRLRLSRVWIVAATALMLVIQYSTPQTLWPGAPDWMTSREIWLVAGYGLAQWGIARAFLAIRQRAKSRPALYTALVLALAPLVAVKFVPLFTPSYTLGFLGISYVTFRSLDVIICVQDGLISSLPIVQYLAYLLFFPTISSGPVDRYRRFALDWNRDRSRAEFLQDLDEAIHHIFRGLLYKFILAALIKQYWMDPVAQGTRALDIASYMYAYSFYLFFDFAGYSAFAVGLSYLLGIHTPENFRLPFLARNIRDFWDRWHISLSWWFRDHIYMRFVLAATKGHWFKNRYVASYLGFVVTMGLMGLWHGTAWHYIIYGLYHGTLLAGHDAFARWNKQRGLVGQGRLWQATSIFATFNAVCFGLLIFSGRLF